MALKETLKQKIEEFRPRTAKLVKEFGKVVIDQVTIDQAFGSVTSSVIRESRTPVLLAPPGCDTTFYARGKT